ncbi:free fatty acid receptor 2-like [Hyla sarda]|uniref:free fatty acid receptor 2-like n=1 Tax=Hyla sarda TaxID=327740 RepID=UPI0024C2B612|nr:free fatty acid receptor 2-like [Hyla sarda]XP_056399452.1 free fatty acid receptor 2-like [Hyla sarda]XP_056399454.1 free fatty acid receptor 2-like [Hyla sarda]XP_056399455.1 free fatty acid receptor 2-like [Hyla sarda]XP_056399456.1 free fatty acid receptor 2-like [Hyla sarda]
MSSTIYTPLVLCIYILAFVTGVPSNLLACYTFLVKVRQKPSPVGLFLLNLTISDLLLLFVLPFKMVEAVSGMTWPMPLFLCPIVTWVYFCSIYISILFLTAVSIERYLGVAYPMKYKVIRKTVYAVWICGFIWGFSALHGSVSFIVITVLPSNESQDGRCYQRFTAGQKKLLMPFRLEGSLLMFFIPFMITIFCYFNFVRLLLSMPKIRRKKKYRAICLAVATLFNFTLCFVPYNISHIVGFIQDKSSHWRVYALLLTTLNASIDPIIFYYSSTAVQKTFLKCLQGLKKKLCMQDNHEVHVELSKTSDTRTTYNNETSV